MDVKKIIITGAPRTGTTVLTTLLCSAPNILVTNELGIFDYNPNNFYSKKDALFKDRVNQPLLKLKGLSEKDIEDFYVGNFRNKGDIEFFGDKHPNYSWDENCDHLVKEYPNAYFIFTYRNPCSIIYSELYKHEMRNYMNENNKNFKKQDLEFSNLENLIKRLEGFVLNWSKLIFPNVKNKIIIDYDHYVNNVDLLIKDLSKYLKINSNLFDLKESIICTLESDVSYEKSRKLYTNLKSKAYKNFFSDEEIKFILDNTKELDQYVRSLICQQKKYEI